MFSMWIVSRVCVASPRPCDGGGITRVTETDYSCRRKAQFRIAEKQTATVL